MKFTISPKQQDVLRWHLQSNSGFTEEEREILAPFLEELKKQHAKHVEKITYAEEPIKFKIGEAVEGVKYTRGKYVIVGARRDKYGKVYYATTDYGKVPRSYRYVSEYRQHCFESMGKFPRSAIRGCIIK